jgi:hypothetical protein
MRIKKLRFLHHRLPKIADKQIADHGLQSALRFSISVREITYKTPRVAPSFARIHHPPGLLLLQSHPFLPPWILNLRGGRLVLTWTVRP